MEKKLSQILSKNKDLIPQMKYRQLMQHYSKLKHLYGQTMIHKDGIPLRPIVSNRNLVWHPLSFFLGKIVTPLRNKSSSCQKLYPFHGKINKASIHSNQMVSLYVVSLCPRVSIDDALTVVKDQLATDPSLKEGTCILIDNLKEMLTFCVEMTKFRMGSDIYWQE